MLMTDGECDSPQKTIEMADKIKNLRLGISIYTAFFTGSTTSINEAENAKSLLVSVANRPDCFTEVYDEETLRLFFESSLTTNVGGIQILQ
jgi:hypothetical protein